MQGGEGMNVQLDCLGHLQGERLFEGRRRVPWIFVVIFLLICILDFMQFSLAQSFIFNFLTNCTTDVR